MKVKKGSGMGGAAAVLMGSVLFSRVLGLLREALLAGRLGTGLDADAYAVAFMLPDLLNTLLAGGFLSISFVPLYRRLYDQEGEERAGRFLGNIQLFFGGAGVLGIIVLWIFAAPLVTLLQPGLAGTPVLGLSVHLTRILLPAQLFFLLAGAWNGAQYAHKQFFYPALAPLVYNAGILAGGVFLAPSLGAEGFAWGVLAGAFVGHFALQLWGTRQAGVRSTVRLDDEGRRELKGYLWQTLPLMLGLTLGFSAEFLLRRMAGFLGQGAVAEANYAFRLTMVLVAFFGQAAGVASYPYLVELASQGRHGELDALVRGAVSRLSAVLVPASVLTWVLAPELVALAFQRGHFQAAQTVAVAGQLRWMVWAVLPWCVQIVHARAFYAGGRFWSTAGLGTVLVLASWPLWAGLCQVSGRLGAAQGVLLLVGLQGVGFWLAWRRLQDMRWSGWGLKRPLILSLPLGAAVWGLLSILPSGNVLRALVGGGTFMAVYLLLALWWGLPGMAEFGSKLARLAARLPGVGRRGTAG